MGAGSDHDPTKVCLIYYQLLHLKWKYNRVYLDYHLYFSACFRLIKGIGTYGGIVAFGLKYWIELESLLPLVLSLIIYLFGPLLCHFVLLALVVRDLWSYSPESFSWVVSTSIQIGSWEKLQSQPQKRGLGMWLLVYIFGSFFHLISLDATTSVNRQTRNAKNAQKAWNIHQWKKNLHCLSPSDGAQ